MKGGIVLAVLGLLAVAGWAVLQSGDTARHILIAEALVKPADDGAVALAAIDNTGPPDRLIAVSSPAAQATLYSPAAQDGLPIPTGTASLALDAAHIRLAAATFQDGDLIPLTLTFANAGEVTLKARLSDPAATGAAEEVGLFGFGDICVVGDGEPAPQISLRVTPDSDGWRVDIDAEEFEFSNDLVGLYHVPGMGHGHLYVGGMKLGRLYAPTAHIGALPKGRHEVRVTLNTNDHRAYVVEDMPVTAQAVIEVD